MQYTMYSDEYFMNEALKEAQKALEIDEVPVGVVIVSRNKIIARSHNMTEKLSDATAHAEMIAITSAENYLGSKYLNDCTMYVTLEPCLMCASASAWTQLGKLIYGSADPKAGFSLVKGKVLHPKTKLIKGVLETECSKILSEFFKMKRKKTKESL